MITYMSEVTFDKIKVLQKFFIKTLKIRLYEINF